MTCIHTFDNILVKSYSRLKNKVSFINYMNWQWRAPAEQLFWVIHLFSLLMMLFKTPEGVVVGFRIFAWAPNSQKY